MYGKIFASMYDGSLYGQWQAIVTFQQMIVLCNEDGILDMTPQALAARTSIPLEIIKAGLDLLEKPDQYSRTRDHDGRRIELIDADRPWGWRIINHRKYRQMVSLEQKREADRMRLAMKRAAEKNTATKSDSERQDATKSDKSQVSQSVANVAHTDTDTDKTPSRKKRAKRADSDPAFARFWTEYPRKRGRADAAKAFEALAPDDEMLRVMLAAVKQDAKSEQWRRDGGQFIPYPARWLRSRRWEDGEDQPAQPGKSGPAWLHDGSLGPII